MEQGIPTLLNHYRFETEEQAMATLNEAGYLVQDYEIDPETGEEVPSGAPHLPHCNHGPGYDIIMLGTLMDRSNPIEGVDEEGNPYVTYAPLEGYHLDILSNNVPEAMEPFLVTPANPQHCV